MATKGLNDYSAMGNIFRDSALGVLISTGLLGTMVPNSIEAVGKVQELNSFLTLSLFSVIYFVFPVFIFTSYWLFRGERMFFVEKFSKIEFDRNRVKELKEAIENETSMKELTWIKIVLFAGKLAPLCLFIYDQEFFARLGFTYQLAVYYFVLAALQNYYCILSNKKWLFDERIDLGKKRARNFQYWSYCVNSLVFFLDIIIGLALVMFSKPWIFYSNEFHAWIATVIVTYALGSLYYSFHEFKDQRLRLEDFVVAVLLASAGLAFPSVNLNGNGTIALLTLLWFMVVGTVWVFSKKESDTNDSVPDQRLKMLMNALIPALVVLVAATMFNCWMILGNESSNLTYMTLRFEASQQLSTKEYYPLSRDTLIARKISLEIHKRNITPERLRDSLTWKGFPDTINLRKKYFPKYYREDSMARRNHPLVAPASTLASKYFRNQDSIDAFYDDIYQMAEKTITPSYFHHRYDSPQYAVMRAYAHPLDYMGARLKRLKDNKDKAEDMIDLSEQLLRISLMRFARSQTDTAHWTQPTLATEGLKSAAEELNKLKKGSPELADDAPYLISAPDSAYHARLVKFHKLYYEFCELKYIEAYKGAQKVYRSYLVDTQRIGVWAFFVTLLVLALATYFNNRARFIFQPVNKDEENAEKQPLDTPRNALFIQAVAIFILLVPLMKPIEPEHIDPEKSYWMISLQSWHTASFFSAITDKDEDKHHYTPGRTVVITTPPDFTELRKSIEGLSNGITESAKELGKIQKELAKIRTEAETQDGKVRKRGTNTPQGAKTTNRPNE